MKDTIDKRIKSVIRNPQRRTIFIFAGFLFFALQVLVLLGNYRAVHYDVFFWFCNHTPLIFSLAFLLGKDDLIKGLVNVGFIAQFAWTLDLLFKLMFDTYLFGVCSYVFEESTGFWILIPIGIHVFATNFALILTANVKPGKMTLFYSSVYLLVLYGASLIYTMPSENVNCVHYLCGFPELKTDWYNYLWTVITFCFIVLPTQGIQYLVYLWCRRTGLGSGRS